MTRITLAEKQRLLAQRKAELGIRGRSYVAANPGTRRTISKQRLLRAIAEEARARGQAPRFVPAKG